MPLLVTWVKWILIVADDVGSDGDFTKEWTFSGIKN